MRETNSWLKDYCNKSNIRFIYIYSYFVDKLSGKLNKGLFNGSLLHFNSRGDSVLGKVMIAASNRPRSL